MSLKGIMALLLSASLVVASPQPVVSYEQAVDALYNLDFSIAESAFHSLIQKDESNPDNWNGLASTIWLKILYDQQKLNADSYSGADIGGKRSRDAVSADDEKRLRDTVNTAITKANAMLAKNPKDIRALYALGVANATLAAFEGIAQRSYIAAVNRAKSAKNYHQQVLKLDPAFHDAQLSIGTFDYGVSIIPRLYRMIACFMGVCGSGKAEGIRKLELAMRQGTRTTTDARMILIVAYNREKRFVESLHLLDELRSKYPRNFQFELEQGGVHEKMKDWNGAVQVYQHVLSKIAAKQDGYERLREELVYRELGEANVNRLNLDEAIAAFNKVVTGAKATPAEKADAFIWLGKIYDSQNLRPKAVEQYRAVLKLDCDPGYKETAQGFIKKPYKG